MPLGISPFCQEVFFYMAQIFVCDYYFPDNKLLLLLLIIIRARPTKVKVISKIKRQCPREQ